MRLSLQAICFIASTPIQAFYIPGFTFNTYADGDRIPLHVNKIYSDNSLLKFSYAELPFVCHPSGQQHASSIVSGSSLSLNVGEVFRGDRIIASDYELRMNQDDEIHLLCSKKVDQDDLRRAQELVGGFVVEWIVDNLPGATPFTTDDGTRTYYAAGFRLGYSEVSADGGTPRYFINNHVTLVIRYHKAPGIDNGPERKAIVGFEVYPRSVLGNDAGVPADWNASTQAFELSMGASATPPSEAESSGDGWSMNIPYTYSVYFQEDEGVEWANRWDMYLANQDGSRVHWLAIINSLVIAGLLAAVVAVILNRTITGDIKGTEEYKLEDGNQPQKALDAGFRDGNLLSSEFRTRVDVMSDESLENVSGWKLVHADVFRSPHSAYLLPPLVGAGIELIFTASGLLLLSCAGILNPSFRGGFISMGLGLFLFGGLLAGYYSSRLYKTFGGQAWRKNVFITSTFVPGLLFVILFCLNILVWSQASSTALPFTTLLALISLWVLVQLPLVYVGGSVGFNRAGQYHQPIKPSATPRQIPLPGLWSRFTQLAILWGLVPFAVMLIELMFVFKSVWQDKTGYYYLFGFLGVVSAVLTVTIAEVTTVAVYLQLCREDYRWWWQSFFIGSASSVWIFAYCFYYFFAKLHVYGFVSGLLFFGYSFIACALYGLLTGTVGFLTGYAFVRRIYGDIKVD